MIFRVIDAKLKVEFDLAKDEFKDEFSNSCNSLDEWVSLLKAKEESENTDPLTLKLLTQVLKKLENIENLLSKNEHTTLANVKFTNKIGYEGFCFSDDCLEVGKEYFARIHLQSFTKNQLKIYFLALDEKTAKITKISKFDEKEWSQNIARMELGAIRLQKGNV